MTRTNIAILFGLRQNEDSYMEIFESGNYSDQASAAASSDPDGEVWSIMLPHSRFREDFRVACKLLQVSCSTASAVHTQMAGKLAVQLTASSLARAQQFAGWMQHNSILLHSVCVSFTEADRCPWVVSTAVEGAAAAVQAVRGGLALHAATPSPPPPSAAAAAAAAPVVAAATGLRAFKARGVLASSASSLTASLHGVAGQLTQFELGMLLCMQHHQWGETTAPFTPDPAGVGVLAAMTALRTLVLHQPCNVEPNMAGCLWPALQDCVQQCVAGMAQLTCLELPLQPGDSSSFSFLLQCLPDSLQELRLGADAAGQQDEGANAFEAAEAAEVLQGRQQHPFDLSHLTALTKLQLSAFAPVVTGDQLPRSLLQLRLRQCFDVQPLLQLIQLQAVSLRPSTIPAHQLMALTQLTCLTSVQLFYEGGYQQCEGFTHWSGERLAEQAAVWGKLPLTSLGLYEGSGPYEGGEFDPLGRRLCTACVTQLQQLHMLTSLSLHWPLEEDMLTGIGQLQQLRSLSVRWDWYDEYVGSKWAEHTPAELAACADSVMSVMHAFASLPQMQQLSWLCDEERDLCLSLAGLRGVLQQLGQRGQSSDGRLSVDELAGLVELHMEKCGD